MGARHPGRAARERGRLTGLPRAITDIVRDILRLLGANVVARFVGIVAIVVYARLLSPRDLAALPVFLILGAFTTIPFNFGLYPTLIREVPVELERQPERARGLIRMTILTVGAGVIVAALAYVLAAMPLARLFFHDERAAGLIRWMGVGTAARGADEIITFVLRATREFHTLARKKIVSELSQPLLAMTLIGPLGVRGLILGSTIGLVVGLGYGIWGVRSYCFGPSIPVPALPTIRRSLPYYVEGAIFFVCQQGDQALVAMLLTPLALAAYYIARRVPDALGLVLYAIEEVMGPSLVRARLDTEKHFHRTFAALTLSVSAFALAGGAAAAALAPAYLTLIHDPRYAGLTPVVALLALGLIPQGIVTVVSQVALALGHPSDRLRITTVFGGMLLGLTALSASHGLVAIAIGRDTAILVSAAFGTWVIRRLVPPVPWASLLRFLLPSLVLAGILLALQRLDKSLWLVPTYVLVASLAGLVTWLGILTPADRARLRLPWPSRR